MGIFLLDCGFWLLSGEIMWSVRLIGGDLGGVVGFGGVFIIKGGLLGRGFIEDINKWGYFFDISNYLVNFGYWVL